jgi:hypothetical protein
MTMTAIAIVSILGLPSSIWRARPSRLEKTMTFMP